LAVRLVIALADDADHDIVRNQFALVQDGLDPQAQRRAGRHGGAQHVAGRELRQSARPGQDLGLGALAGTRGPEQHKVQRRAPRNFDFLSSPSYCCATRWLWICATVSIVTETTIRIEVPPMA